MGWYQRRVHGDTLPFSFAQNTHLTMNAFILLACVAASSAQHVAYPYVNGVPIGYAGAAPVAAPVYNTAAYPYAAPVAPAPVAPSSQFQAQDEFGNLQYGYANINSQKHEIGNTYGGVTGGFHYVDANGVVQTRQYIADHLGFRVQATDLPVAPAVPEVEPLVAPVHEYELPVAPVFEGKAPVHEYTLPVAPVFDGKAPEPVQDTPEVAAAKAEHLALLEAATAERRRRSTPADTERLEVAAPVLATAPVAAPVAPLAYGLPAAGYGYGLPAAGYGYAGLPAAAPVAVPAPVVPAGAVVASAPATAEATLTTVKLNPGHAVAYRVD